MSAQIPRDMIDTIANLEAEASRSLSRGNYVLAGRLYDIIFLSLFERQYNENRRIHLGAPLHMEGLSLILQNKFNEGLKSILLAYITDLINTPLGQEDEADQAPARKVLSEFFAVPPEVFKQLKSLSRKVTNRNQPFDPREILNRFMTENSISDVNITKLVSHQPTPQQIMTIRPRFYEIVTIETVDKKGQTNINKLNPILSSLFQNPDATKYLPSVLNEPNVHILTILSDTFFVLSFFNEKEWAKIQDFRERGLQPPLPFLIKPEKSIRSAAFEDNNLKNILYKNTLVKGGYSFSLGKDSTILLCNHRQIVESPELTADYTIGLAYIVSFGEEITSNNFYDYLENLAAYSFKIWRS